MYSTAHENAFKKSLAIFEACIKAPTALLASTYMYMYVVNSLPESTRNTRRMKYTFVLCQTDEAECKCHCAQIMPIHECLDLLCNVYYNNYTFF